MLSEETKEEGVSEGIPKESLEAEEAGEEPKGTDELKEAQESAGDAALNTLETNESRGKKEFEGDIEIDDDTVALTFPQRLMEILEDEEYSDVISWLPHGRGFVIFKKKAFEEKILPKHFNKQSKYSSFTRKLNRWGFVRVTRGPESGAYYHPCFRRGGHRLCMQMSCQSSTKTRVVKASTTANATNVLGSVYPGVLVNQAALQPQLQFAQTQLQIQQQQQQQMIQQEMMRRAAMMNQPQPQDVMYMPMQMMANPTQQPGVATPVASALYQQLPQMNESAQMAGSGMNNAMYTSGGALPPT